MPALPATLRPWTALLALCCLLLAQVAAAIPLDRKITQLYHKAWLAKDGVPPSLTAMAQTGDGYLWLGTVDGMFRFDGVRFERYQPRQGRLPNATAYTLVAQPGGGLWIGWFQGGISFLKDGVLTDYPEADGIGAGTVWGFDVDRDGAVWAAGSRGVARFAHGRWQKMGPREGFTARKASAVFVDRDGTVGAFSEQGLFLWRRDRSSFAPPIGRPDPRLPPRPPQRGPDGRLYLLDENGIRVVDSLARYDQAEPHWIYRSPKPEDGRMLIDSSGSLWFDTDAGLHRIDPDSKGQFNAAGLRAGTESYTRKDGLSDGQIGQFLEDREHNIWLLSTAGLERFRQVDVNRVTLREGSDSNSARLLAASDGSMQMAGVAAGASWLRLAADGMVLAQRPGIGVSAMLQARDGSVLVTARAGLQRWRADKLQATLPLPPDLGPLNMVHALALGHDGTLWASVPGVGVSRYRNGRWEREPLLPEQGKRPAMSIFADRRGRMWFGYADNTIARLDGQKITLYSSAQGVELGRVAVLYEAQGQLWAGGQDGVAMLRGERFTPWSIAPAKLSNVSGMLIAPSGDMWLNASAGIVQLPAAEVRQAIASAQYVARGRIFDALDGLLGLTQLLQVQSIEMASDGKIWFSTRDATAWIDPARLLPRAAPPPVLIEALRAGDVRHQEPTRLTLAPNSRDVQIDYTIALLGTPERLRFRFFLDGYDQQWHDAGARRQAFYTGLPPGDYHFRVIAEHGDGNWGPEGDGLHFSVLPAWYQTWWFRALLAATAVVLAWLLYRFRLNRVKLLYKVQLEVRQAERERIARELHDTLLQGTLALILRIHNATARLPQGDPARAIMDEALNQADAMLAEGRDQVYDLRAGDLFGAGAAALIARDGATLAKEHGIVFTWRERGKRRDILPATAHELYRIAMEAISNAVRHARANTIRVELAYRFTRLELTVADDGQGLPEEVRAQGGRDGHWGLPGLRERAARLRARLRIDSAAQTGTVIRLRIPGHLAYGRPITAPAWFRRRP